MLGNIFEDTVLPRGNIDKIYNQRPMATTLNQNTYSQYWWKHDYVGHNTLKPIKRGYTLSRYKRSYSENNAKMVHA